MKLFLSILILFSATTLQAKVVFNIEHMIISKSKDIEDTQVFETFLFYVLDEIVPIEFAAQSLGYDIEDKKDLTEFRRFQQKMKLVDKRLKRSLRESWHEVNCNSVKTPYSKTHKELYKDIDTTNEMRTKILSNHLKRTLRSLPIKERTSMRNCLNEIKENTTVVISDIDIHENIHTNEMRANLAASCAGELSEFIITD